MSRRERIAKKLAAGPFPFYRENMAAIKKELDAPPITRWLRSAR